jgi:hypothetical protein
LEDLIANILKDAPLPWRVVLCTFAFWAVKYLRDLAQSVSTLNQTLLILVHRTDGHEAMLKDHEVRIRDVEKVG